MSRFQAGPGNALRDARIAAGLTLTGFAELLSVSVSCASRWETDIRRPHSSQLVRIAEVLTQPRSEVAGWFRDVPVLATEAARNAHGLRRLRQQTTMSRADLAAHLGVSPATVAHWECGRRAVPAARWAGLAAVLNMTERDLLSRMREPVQVRPVAPLAQLRLARQLNQRHVARCLGVTHPLVSSWERGVRVPSWPQIRRLSVVLTIPVATVAQAVGREPPQHLDQTRWTSQSLPHVLREGPAVARGFEGSCRAQGGGSPADAASLGDRPVPTEHGSLSRAGGRARASARRPPVKPNADGRFVDSSVQARVGWRHGTVKPRPKTWSQARKRRATPSAAAGFSRFSGPDATASSA